MLRAHYRKTPKLQAGRSKKGKDNGSKEGRKEKKEMKVKEVGQVYHESPVAKIFQSTGIPKQHSRDCHIEFSTIVLSQNTQLGLAKYKLLRNS